MLHKIRIKNFKSFQDTGDLEIKPITIFVGPNSSGKSSIFKFLLMLRQTIDGRDSSNALITNEKWVSAGSYPEFIYNGESNRDLEIELELDQGSPFLRDTNNGKLSFKSTFTYVKKNTRIRLSALDAKIEGFMSYKLRLKTKGAKYYNLCVDYEKSSKSFSNVSTQKALPNKFIGYLIRPDTLKGNDLNSFFLSMQLQNNFEMFFRNLYYIGPLRDYPKRIYLSSGESPEDVGLKGERSVDVLWYCQLKGKNDLNNVVSKTKLWFERFGFSGDLKLNRLSKEGINYELMITDPQIGCMTNIADVGFGVSQTLPIILECFYAQPKSLILIEQPEIHLHPKAQSVLGDLFVEAVSNKDRQIIIETHSEHLISRIRRRIAEDENFSNEDLAIYYFNKTKEGTVIEKIEVDEDGFFSKYPEGFFSESYEEAYQHMKSVSSKKTKGE